jgi:hypothetical protein
MPFPLDDVFSSTQKQYIPKGMTTLEDVALASWQDIPIKKGWEYITAARRYLAKEILERIWREGDQFVVRIRAGVEYPEELAIRLYSAIAQPYINFSSLDRIQFIEKVGRDYRYRVRFDSEYERQSFEKFDRVEFEQIKKDEQSTQDIQLPPDLDLFGAIIGYDDAKKIFVRSLRSTKPVHILLVGPPASAKTLFLLEVARLPGSVYALGGSSTKAGLADLIFNQKPSYLLIDELDKMNQEDYSVLLSLCETGIVSEAKYGRRREVTVNTKVYAAANTLDKVPPEVQSRFLILRFPPYNKYEYREVVKNVLVKREGVMSELAEYIAEKVSSRLGTVDVRDAIRIARLASNTSEVDDILASISKYK